jgi:hypothetical protein
MENETEENARFFSVELKSKADLKNVTLANSSHDSVLIEGSIGELVQATFAEGIILEIIGKKGTLRINLAPKELKKPPQTATTSEKPQKGHCGAAQLKNESQEVK